MVRSIKNLIAAVLIAISAYLVWTEMLTAYTVTNYMEDQIQSKTELLASRTEIIDSIEKLRKESDTKHLELQRLALVVPEKKDVSELITAINTIYTSSGLILPQIELGGGPAVSGLGKIGFTAVGRGKYGQFLTFLDYLQKNIRLFDAEAVNIGLSSETGGSSGSNRGDPELSFSIRGWFYWIEPTKEAKASETAGTPKSE